MTGITAIVLLVSAAAGAIAQTNAPAKPLGSAETSVSTEASVSAQTSVFAEVPVSGQTPVAPQTPASSPAPTQAAASSLSPKPVVVVPAGVIELRATDALAAGEYDVAAALLAKLVNDPAIEPARRERLAEMLRVAQKNLAAEASGAPKPDEAPGDTAAASGSGASNVSKAPQGVPARSLGSGEPAAATAGSASSSPTLPAKPGDPARVETAAGKRTPHVRPPDGQALALTFQQLGNFDYDPDEGGNIPDDVLALTGTTIRVKGYMLPLDGADRFTQFAMVADLTSCCFGQPPQVHHIIMVQCPEGKSLAYYPDPVLVTGVLNVNEKKDDGFVVSLFDLTATSVKPAPR